MRNVPFTITLRDPQQVEIKAPPQELDAIFAQLSGETIECERTEHSLIIARSDWKKAVGLLFDGER